MNKKPAAAAKHRADEKHAGESERSEGHRPGLRSVPGGAGARPAGVASLLSGKVGDRGKRPRRSRKPERRPEELPGEMRVFGDLLAAGKKVEREVDFKLRFAEQRIREFCLRRFCEKFALTGRRPDSISYVGPHSRFTYTQTRRIAMTPERADALRDMGFPIDEHTELRGLRINYEAIREHKLESRLKEALEGMGLDQEILDECFVPDVQVRDGFFESLPSIVSRTAKDEDLGERLYEIARVLAPSGQIRNAETPDLDAEGAFKLIEQTQIAPPSGEEELGGELPPEPQEGREEGGEEDGEERG